MDELLSNEKNIQHENYRYEFPNSAKITDIFRLMYASLICVLFKLTINLTDYKHHVPVSFS